jgi:hypothetical protein
MCKPVRKQRLAHTLAFAFMHTPWRGVYPIVRPWRFPLVATNGRFGLRYRQCPLHRRTVAARRNQTSCDSIEAPALSGKRTVGAAAILAKATLRGHLLARIRRQAH